MTESKKKTTPALPGIESTVKPPKRPKPIKIPEFDTVGELVEWVKAQPVKPSPRELAEAMDKIVAEIGL